MKLLALADTHLEFPRVSDLPNADLFIHAGDWTDIGYRHSKLEFARFESFLRDAKARYSHVLALHGNHDLGFDNGRWAQWGVTPINGLTWQHPSGLTVHGVALTPAHHLPELLLEWQYMTIDEDEEDAAWDFQRVDVVVSHGPPFGYLDLTNSGQRIGSRSAVSYIRTRQPQVFICGHVHEAAGEAQLRETRILNVAGRVALLEVKAGDWRPSDDI